MIYIKVQKKDRVTENEFIRNNIDLGSGDTFIENRLGHCLISIPDNGTQYAERMKARYGSTKKKPELPLLPDEAH